MMLRLFLLSAVVLAGVGLGPATGQPLLDVQPPGAPVGVGPDSGPGQKPPTPDVRPAPPATPGVMVPSPPGKLRGRDLNLQVEITIADQSGTEAPQKKVVSMLVADGTMGRVRASADAQRAGVGYVGTGLNVDAHPVVLENDRILLHLTVEYTPFREGGQVTQRPTILNESLSVILQNGKPITVSQAADPVTDRKMTVEVRASIVK